MSDMSLWKRVGGWLRRSQSSTGGSDAAQLDAEGLMMSPTLEEAVEPERNSVLVRPGAKQGQLAAMEEGFSRLVEVLDAINENVTQHRRHSEEFKGYLADLSDTIRAIPDAAARQEEAAKQLNEELRSQAMRQQQLLEMMQTLPDLSESQVEKLEDIRRQLGSAAEQDARLAQSLIQFDQASQAMLQNTDSQTNAVKEMAATAQTNAQQLHSLLSRQGRRMMLVVIILLLIILAMGGLIIWQLLPKPI